MKTLKEAEDRRRNGGGAAQAAREDPVEEEDDMPGDRFLVQADGGGLRSR